MTEPRRPFYVSFTHDSIPQQVDHSRSQPGPAGAAASRAGFTSVTSNGRYTDFWDRGPVGPDGRFPIFAVSVNIYMRLTDFVIAISSDFSAQSCAYRVTHRHELEAHIYDPIRIFHSYRETLIRRLNAITVPTREAPIRVLSESEAGARQTEITQRIIRVVGQTRRELTAAMNHARDTHDAAASYRLVYNQCTDAEWASGR